MEYGNNNIKFGVGWKDTNKYKLALEFHISKEAEPIEKNGAKRLNQQTDETINKKLVNDFEK